MKMFRILTAATAVLTLASGPAPAKEVTDLFQRAPWSVSFGAGEIKYEGDEQVEDGPFIYLRLGYDFSPRWTFEADLNFMPNLPARKFDDPRREPLDDDARAVRLGLDVLYHLRTIKNLRFDPYLSAGIGGIYYDEKLEDGNTDYMIIGGAGLFYHFNDEWAIRADGRLVAAGPDTEANALISAGVNWRWGARLKPKYALLPGELDSDNDGLLDSQEEQYGTDPYDPDSDDDGLSDGEEIKTYRTDPLNPDTDLDALLDGAEALTHHTDPLQRDTDGGGVADGHEVIEDNTNPLDPSDDLQLYTLNIEFDYDKADIRPEYFDQLDVIVKVLQRDPEATARIEGHADKRPTSDREYNLRLSERRAKAVYDYLVNVGGIDPSRLTYKGYGFDRPVAPNDTEENMQKNRRVEIYIRPGSQQSHGPAGEEMPVK